MPVKTKTDLQTENSKLKEKLNMVENNFEKLSGEHKSLQADFKIEKERRNQRCSNCDHKSENKINLKKHKNEHRSRSEIIKCEQCEKEFSEEWKLRAHEKKHKKYQCDQCDKTFEYLDIKKKHILISHEKTKLYCHFFNNQKTCPFEER